MSRNSALALPTYTRALESPVSPVLPQYLFPGPNLLAVASSEVVPYLRPHTGGPEDLCCCGHRRDTHYNGAWCSCGCVNFCDCHLIVAEMRQEWAEEEAQALKAHLESGPFTLAGGKPCATTP
jgi:hypothetical protein